MPQAKISRISEWLSRVETVVAQGALASFEKLMSDVMKSFSKFEQPEMLHTAYQIIFKEAIKRNLNEMKNERARKPAKIYTSVAS